MLLIIIAMLLRRWKSATCVDVYLAAYLGILLIWPYAADVRFWIPVQILIIGLILSGAHLIWNSFKSKSLRTTFAVLCVLWLAGFAALGLIAHIYTTRVTYSGDRFCDQYSAVHLRNTYRFAAGQPTLPKPIPDPDPKALWILQRFGNEKTNKIADLTYTPPVAPATKPSM
jgi:hypothetical protein